MSTEIKNQYTDYNYVISQTELDEALWLIEQGDFKDLDDFIESSRRAQISIWLDADKKRAEKAKLRQKKAQAKRKSKAA